MSNQFGALENEVLRHRSLLDDFIQYVELNRTKETADCYESKIRGWIRFVDSLAVDQWTKRTFETFIAKGRKGELSWQKKGWSVRSVQLVLASMKLFGEYLVSHDVLRGVDLSKGEGFWQSVKKPTLTIREARFSTIEQVRRLLEAAEGTRYLPMLALAFGAGMRRAETLRSLWADVDWEKETIRVRRDKTHTDHRVPIAPILMDVLKRLRKDAAGNDRTGPIVGGTKCNISRDLAEIAKGAGVPRINLHGMRHSFATHLMAKRVPANVIMALGGWRNLKTLQRYSHVLDGAAKEAVSLLA